MDDAHRENRALWEAWSDDFQALWRADTDEGELPPAPLLAKDTMSREEERAVLSGLEGADVVEFGCGGGQHSVAFAREGARSVTGVDFSREQLGYARRLAAQYSVGPRFVTADVTRVPLADDAFDFGFSSAALQMVADLDACLGEMRRVLRPGSPFVLDVPHPFYEVFDPETHEIERSYHAPDPRRLSIDDSYDADLLVFDRSVQEWHNALVDAGFRVERVLEPGSDDPEDYHDGGTESSRPALKAKVPRSLLFRTVLAE